MKNKIETRAVKKWETIYFEAQENEEIEVLELNLNLNNQSFIFDITSEHEEGVSFRNITLKQAELRVKALEKAIEYLKEVINK